jgi:signal transduction histidine kinase
VVIAYTLARWVPGYRGLLGLAVVLLLLTGDYVVTDERDNNITDVFFVLSLMAPPFVLGKVARKLAEQGELLRDQQELVKREAVRDERDRIARELHDVIAHSVSAMVVQTAAAQDLVRTDPERAEQVLDDVAATGRRALAETGQLLHVIRDTADELGLEPTPGLAQVPDLVERFRADGLEVRATIDGPLSGLPAAVDTSAYRLVQEALTNALRYAPDHTVDLQLAVVDGRVTINTSNRADGPHHESASQGSGLGLLGLAERVSLLGGTLTHGRTPGGRFELSAVLPAGPA